jgi:uncharacterized protein YbaR (Trm112 family)
MAADSLKLEVLICPLCKKQFGLAVGTGKFVTSDRLPEPFEATCPHCTRVLKFSKASIRVLKL